MILTLYRIDTQEHIHYRGWSDAEEVMVIEWMLSSQGNGRNYRFDTPPVKPEDQAEPPRYVISGALSCFERRSLTVSQFNVGCYSTFHELRYWCVLSKVILDCECVAYGHYLIPVLVRFKKITKFIIWFYYIYDFNRQFDNVETFLSWYRLKYYLNATG